MNCQGSISVVENQRARRARVTIGGKVRLHWSWTSVGKDPGYSPSLLKGLVYLSNRSHGVSGVYLSFCVDRTQTHFWAPWAGVVGLLQQAGRKQPSKGLGHSVVASRCPVAIFTQVALRGYTLFLSLMLLSTTQAARQGGLLPL